MSDQAHRDRARARPLSVSDLLPNRTSPRCGRYDMRLNTFTGLSPRKAGRKTGVVGCRGRPLTVKPQACYPYLPVVDGLRRQLVRWLVAAVSPVKGWNKTGNGGTLEHHNERKQAGLQTSMVVIGVWLLADFHRKVSESGKHHGKIEFRNLEITGPHIVNTFWAGYQHFNY